ncbi:MAG: Hsp70 family protein [Planctomycetes bacterium]|nr:Hsp70 family protein [Planctomycetota bacterium]
MGEELILGIDLGTTNSVVAVIRNGEPVVLGEGEDRLLPSVVGLGPDGALLVGAPARNQGVLAPDRTVRSIKRKIGQETKIQLGDQQYTPQEISAMILRTLRQRAEKHLHLPVRKAVITVPAFFDENQRQATREGGELAGLEVMRIINEPTAASLTYDPTPDRQERILVYDLGGGTFDVSIVSLEEGVVEVLASHGDTHLGGDDFDQLLLDHLCDEFAREHRLDPRDSLAARSRLLRAAEDAKKQLSFEPFVTLQEEFLLESNGKPLHLQREIARREYEELIEPLILKTLRCVDDVLDDAHVAANQLDKVVLVGGASRTPLVHRLLQEQLGQPLHFEVDPDLCVAMGAAIQGGLIAGMDVGRVLVDITPHTLGIQAIAELQGLPSVNAFSPVIERNTPLPATRTQVYHTSYDGQEAAEINVFQGEDPDVRHNQQIGRLMLEGLADAPMGKEILVRFRLDLDGLLHVTAAERATGLEQQARIENAMSRFREEEQAAARQRLAMAFGHVDEVEAEAEHAEAASQSAGEPLPDELRQAVHQAQALIARAEQLSAADQEADDDEMGELVNALRTAIAARSLEDIQDITAKLDDVIYYLEEF